MSYCPNNDRLFFYRIKNFIGKFRDINLENFFAFSGKPFGIFPDLIDLQNHHLLKALTKSMLQLIIPRNGIKLFFCG
jgi:hypothetical protein